MSMHRTGGHKSLLRYSGIRFGAAAAAFLSFAAAADGVVSLSPAVTETICAIGGEKLLRGRCTACNYPESIRKLPAAGELGKPNVEAVLLLAPDLTVSDIAIPGGSWKLLESAKAATLILPCRTLEDYPRNVAELGKRLHLEAGAAAEIARFERELGELKKFRPEKRPDVLVLFSLRPLITCGKNSFVSRLVALAGGNNLGDRYPGDYFVISTEQLALTPPDVVVLTGMNGSDAALPEIPGAADWPAVKNRRITNSVPADEICRLGPRTLKGTAALRRFFFPKTAEFEDPAPKDPDKKD